MQKKFHCLVSFPIILAQNSLSKVKRTEKGNFDKISQQTKERNEKKKKETILFFYYFYFFSWYVCIKDINVTKIGENITDISYIDTDRHMTKSHKKSIKIENIVNILSKFE